MEIKDLQPKQGNVNIVLEVVDKGDVREFQKFGRAGKVCTATAKDTSGEIKLSLWNEQVEMVNIGDKVKIVNGYVNEYQGEKQLTTGRLGKLEVVESGKVYSNNPEKLEEMSEGMDENIPKDISEENIGDFDEE